MSQKPNSSFTDTLAKSLQSVRTAALTSLRASGKAGRAAYRYSKPAARASWKALRKAGRYGVRGLRLTGRGAQWLWRQEMAALTITLFLFAAIVSGLLATVNAATAGPIAEKKAEALQLAMNSVVPDAVFEKTELPASFSDAAVTAFFTAFRDGQIIGYAATVSVSGFGGLIDMVVGLTPSGDVAGVEITAMSETPNIGSKGREQAWLSGFAGKTAGVKLGNGTGNTVEAITGATITSRAITAGVEKALGAAAALLSGGGKP